MHFRSKLAIVSAVAALIAAGGGIAYGQVLAPTPVPCTLDANTLTCPLPAPSTVTSTATTTVTAPPQTVTVTATPTTTAPPTTTTTTTTTTPPAGQTLGVGGVATPAGAVLTTSDSTADKLITSGGTATAPKVYDGQGHKVRSLEVDANYVTIQNFRITGPGQYGIYTEGTGITIQNNDVKGLTPTGDGDMNAITFFGNDTKILYNTAIDFVAGNAGESHTDFIQTWVSTSHPTASSNVTIKGNKATGPANPNRDPSIPSIHQCIMAEDYGKGGNSGGSNSAQTNWFIAENEFSDSWNQCIKLDGQDDVDITRNKFTGSSSRAVLFAAGASQRFWSDNIVGTGYGQVGAPITAGAGPTS